MKNRWKYLICGGLSGAANGFFGGGGGMIFIPLVTRWAKLDTQKAFATCVGVIFPMTAVSAGVYLWRGGLSLSDAMPYIIGGTMGGLVAGRVFKRVPVRLLRKGLALLILYGGWRSLTC
ncbi:MAG: TSUP family transporter [Oscillospiraceae bacterium]